MVRAPRAGQSPVEAPVTTATCSETGLLATAFPFPNNAAPKTGYSGLMPGWIGPWELAILLLVVLLVFGPKRLPEMGRSLGKSMREFKDSISGKDEETAPQLPPPAEVTPPAPTRERDTTAP
jgi:sec-independent protein translocase protein TatA